MELKSTKGTSINLWKEGLDPKKTYNIKKHQIEALEEASTYKGCISGFIFNFRAVERTYFLHIEDFLEFTGQTEKKSINEKDIVNSGGIIIKQKKKRVRFTYDIASFIRDATKREVLT